MPDRSSATSKDLNFQSHTQKQSPKLLTQTWKQETLVGSGHNSGIQMYCILQGVAAFLNLPFLLRYVRVWGPSRT